MGLTKEEYDQVTSNLDDAVVVADPTTEPGKVARDTLRTAFTETGEAWISSALAKVAKEPDPGEAIREVKVMTSLGRDELKATVKEHAPAPLALTSSEKSRSLTSISYAERNLTYLMGQTARNTEINTKVLGLRTSLATVKSDVVADPPIHGTRARIKKRFMKGSRNHNPSTLTHGSRARKKSRYMKPSRF